MIPTTALALLAEDAHFRAIERQFTRVLLEAAHPVAAGRPATVGLPALADLFSPQLPTGEGREAEARRLLYDEVESILEDLIFEPRTLNTSADGVSVELYVLSKALVLAASNQVEFVINPVFWGALSQIAAARRVAAF
jgi:hypothetical protein